MQRILAGLAAVLSVVALLVVLATRGERSDPGFELVDPSPAAAPRSPTQAPQVVNRSAASSVPCAVPMTWNLVHMDPRFEVDPAEARAIVATAAGAWEEAVGRTLFLFEDADADAVDLPVRLVFDERQERGVEQRRMEASLEALDAELEREVGVLEEAVDGLEEIQASHRARVAEFEARLAAFNDTVRTWNEGGGAPDSVRVRLEARAGSLEAEGDALRDERAGLDRRLAEIDGSREAYEQSLDERNRLATELTEAFPPTAVESGLYREAVGRENGRVVSVDREIRVYRFASPDDLLRVVAHELGHALGMGHGGEPGALMNPEFAAGSGGPDRVVVTAADVELLRSRCPDL